MEKSEVASSAKSVDDYARMAASYPKQEHLSEDRRNILLSKLEQIIATPEKDRAIGLGNTERGEIMNLIQNLLKDELETKQSDYNKKRL